MEVVCLRKEPWGIGDGPAYNEICKVQEIIVRPGMEDMYYHKVFKLQRFFRLVDYDFPAATFVGRSIYNEMYFEQVMEDFDLKDELKQLRGVVTINSAKFLYGSPGIDFFEFTFYCPGCQTMHGIRTKDWPMPAGLENDQHKKLFIDNKWTWNGDIYRPTAVPKVTVYREVSRPVNMVGDRLPQAVYEIACSLYIKEGLLIYTGESKHKLASCKIEMLDI